MKPFKNIYVIIGFMLFALFLERVTLFTLPF